MRERTNTMELVENRESAENASQKYLTFVLGGEEYGIDILRVREIIGLPSITKVPQTPDFVKGVINLRGKIYPVIDLRLKFQMEEITNTRETCIIIVDIANNEQSTQMGILVDSVKEVLDILTGEIEPPPSFGSKIKTDYITGIGKAADKVIILLDIEQVLTSEEIVALQELKKD